MPEYATKKDVQEIVEKSSKQIIEDLSDIISNSAQSMHNELQEIRTEIADIRTSLDRLTNNVDGFIKRLEDHEAENKARDHDVARLTRWVEQIAKETGVKLPKH